MEGMDMEVAMRATAGKIAEKAGAYRCLCCGRRQLVGGHDVFQPCKSCQCSIFEPDWRYSDDLSDRPSDMAGEALDEPARQWSIL
jgi:hypothetical protein